MNHPANEKAAIMTTEEAFEIVFELAQQNVLSDEDVLEDPETLGPVQRKQQQACNTVHDFIVNNIFRRQADG